MISPASGIELTPLKTRFSQRFHCQAVNADIVDEKGQSVPQGTKGYLVIKSPWPGMLQTIWKDPDRFKPTYFGKWPGIYYRQATTQSVTLMGTSGSWQSRRSSQSSRTQNWHRRTRKRIGLSPSSL